MKKKSKSFSITIALAIMLLVCLFAHSVGVAGAWFTSSGSVQINVSVSGLNVAVYQLTKDAEGNVVGDGIKLNANDKFTPTYITLEKTISPDEEIPVYLELRNNENSGNYVRFKFEVYLLNNSGDVKIETTNEIVSAAASSAGFILKGDGYYYYQTNDADDVNKVLGKGNIVLIDGFSISESEFINKNLASGTMKIEMSVECSQTDWE